VKRDPSLVRLSRDHNRALVVAVHVERELGTASDAEIDEMQRVVVDFWRSSLLPHFRAECECLLARLVRHTGVSDDLVKRTQADHLSLHGFAVSLRETEDLCRKRELLGQMAALLRDHIRWEEAVLFEAAQELLEASELSAAGADLAERIPGVPPPPPWLH
jgi:hypothetical protein